MQREPAAETKSIEHVHAGGALPDAPTIVPLVEKEAGFLTLDHVGPKLNAIL